MIENTRNKRVGVGQKPRGKQETRGVEAPQREKEVAVAAGQERGVNDPVLEAAEVVLEGGVNSPKNGLFLDLEHPPSLHPRSNIP